MQTTTSLLIQFVSIENEIQMTFRPEMCIAKSLLIQECAHFVESQLIRAVKIRAQSMQFALTATRIQKLSRKATAVLNCQEKEGLQLIVEPIPDASHTRLMTHVTAFAQHLPTQICGRLKTDQTILVPFHFWTSIDRYRSESREMGDQIAER